MRFVRLLTVLIMALCLLACEGGSSSPSSSSTKYEGVNRRFLGILEQSKSEDPAVAKPAKTERKTVCEGIYCESYYDSNGNSLGWIYGIENGIWILKAAYTYYEGNTYRYTVEYNREFYDRYKEYQKKYGFSDYNTGFEYTDAAGFIRYGSSEDPSVTYYEWVMPDGSGSHNLILLNEKGESYLYEFKNYDADRNLIAEAFQTSDLSEFRMLNYEDGSLINETTEITLEDGSKDAKRIDYHDDRTYTVEFTHYTAEMSAEYREVEAYDENDQLRSRYITEYHSDYRLDVLETWRDGELREKITEKKDNDGNTIEYKREVFKK